MTRPQHDVEARATIRDWAAKGFDEVLNRTDNPGKPCEFCYQVPDLTETSYACLLGLYLGDGYTARHPRDVHRLAAGSSPMRATSRNRVAPEQLLH